jgi:hypothetical protein
MFILRFSCFVQMFEYPSTGRGRRLLGDGAGRFGIFGYGALGMYVADFSIPLPLLPFENCPIILASVNAHVSSSLVIIKFVLLGQVIAYPMNVYGLLII